MPNIASLLKTEIARIVRKELKGETVALRKAVATHRKEIAALKRRSTELERQDSKRRKVLVGLPAESAADAGLSRFSAKGLRSQRKRLGLSAAECGVLVGASAQSVYNWEQEKARPRASHLAAIAELKTLGKKSAMEAIASLAT